MCSPLFICTPHSLDSTPTLLPPRRRSFRLSDQISASASFFRLIVHKDVTHIIMSLSRTISLPLRHHATSESSSSLAPLPLMRYGSFGNRRLLLRPPNSNGTSIALKSVQSVPRMPLEMLEHILEHYADSVLSPTYISGGSQKTCYKIFFAPSTLVSKDFRQLALRAFFRALIFRTTDDCSRVLRFLDLLNARYLANGWIGGYRWVRFVKRLSQVVSVVRSWC